MINNVLIVGRITHDLELRKTSTDKSVCEFSVAVNRIGQDTTDFITCQVWNKQADNLVKYCEKGCLIGIEGCLRIDQYKDKEDKIRTKAYVLANKLSFLQTKKQEAKQEKNEKPKEDLFKEFGEEVDKVFSGNDEVELTLPF